MRAIEEIMKELDAAYSDMEKARYKGPEGEEARKRKDVLCNELDDYEGPGIEGVPVLRKVERLELIGKLFSHLREVEGKLKNDLYMRGLDGGFNDELNCILEARDVFRGFAQSIAMMNLGKDVIAPLDDILGM